MESGGYVQHAETILQKPEWFCEFYYGGPAHPVFPAEQCAESNDFSAEENGAAGLHGGLECL